VNVFGDHSRAESKGNFDCYKENLVEMKIKARVSVDYGLRLQKFEK
jgi:hypothetical protein